MDCLTQELDYQAWLRYEKIANERLLKQYGAWCGRIVLPNQTMVSDPVKQELLDALESLLGLKPVVSATATAEFDQYLLVGKTGADSVVDQLITAAEADRIGCEGFVIKTVKDAGRKLILIAAGSDRGLLYGVFAFLRLLLTGQAIDELNRIEAPVNPLRMINHWDNLDGSIERGYAGQSIFYEQGRLTANLDRVRDYARLLASVGINSIVINNVNVHREETRLIRERLEQVAQLAAIFRNYGVKLFLSINFAAPIELDGLLTADPLDAGVRQWWRETVVRIYREIPDFGGFLVKADSEHRPGPFTYHRNHAQGANLLAEALKPFGGLVIWRCFVYNCVQDWRDRSIDRAKAAYENFQPLDGQFAENVILQIKNGPMDFQVREPVSPLFGALLRTNQLLELQITQEYTGQQIHLCYLVPQWKEILDFDTYAQGEGSLVKRVVAGSLFAGKYGGLAAVANIGNDSNWTGHLLAQANFYGFARLAWDPDLTAAAITAEWVGATFGTDPQIVETISEMLLASWRIYENYNAPLGIGWMVNPNHHYGPNVDGYEYSQWGTYHRADCQGIGIDRSVQSGTGYAGLYHPENATRYETVADCPEELLLFFHHVPYTHRLKSGKTVIQHIYDTHFEGVEQVRELIKSWEGLRAKLDPKRFGQVLDRLNQQLADAEEWRDVINTYFFRKTGIPDQQGRKIY